MFQTMSNTKNIPVVLIRDCNNFFFTKEGWKREWEERREEWRKGKEKRKEDKILQKGLHILVAHHRIFNL